MKWQPIETAPMDGTWILAIRGKFIPAVAQWNTAYGKWMVEAEEDWPPDIWEEEIAPCEYSPTHWMPLPDAPKGD